MRVLRLGDKRDAGVLNSWHGLSQFCPTQILESFTTEEPLVSGDFEDDVSWVFLKIDEMGLGLESLDASGGGCSGRREQEEEGDERYCRKMHLIIQFTPPGRRGSLRSTSGVLSLFVRSYGARRARSRCHFSGAVAGRTHLTPECCDADLLFQQGVESCALPSLLLLVLFGLYSMISIGEEAHWKKVQSSRGRASIPF